MVALYSRLFQQVQRDFIGFTALAIIFSTALGSVAIMYTLSNGYDFFNMFQVFLVVAVCSAHNASILTVQKPELVFRLLLLSILISSLLIIFNI